MNRNTTRSPAYTSIRTLATLPLEVLYSIYSNPLPVKRFYQIGYPLTFLLGIVGNIANLLTFSRAKLRKLPIGLLFIILAVSDTLALLMYLIDIVEFSLQIRFYPFIRYNEFCRFRSFILNGSQCLSAWILVTISLERWIRTRFPYQSRSWCTRKAATVVVCIILVIDIGLHSHLLSSMYGVLIPGFVVFACGPIGSSNSYQSFYYLEWSIVQIMIICLMPGTIMLVCVINIFIIVRIRKRAVMDASSSHIQNIQLRQQKYLHLQMLILMLTNVCLFIITNLPITIYRVISPREPRLVISIMDMATISTGLGWLQSLNYAMNFYIHCLTSKLFRKEFQLRIKTLFDIRSNQRVIAFVNPT